MTLLSPEKILTFEEFCTDTNLKGKINVSLFPNGVEKNDKGEILCKFSLLFGININPKAYYSESVVDLSFIKQVATRLNDTSSQFTIKFRKNDPNETWASARPFRSKVEFISEKDHLKRWATLFGNEKFIIGKQVRLQRSGADEPEMLDDEWISKRMANRKDFFEGYDTPSQVHVEGILNNSADVIASNRTGDANSSLNEALLKRESRFESLNTAGRAIVDRVAAQKQVRIKAFNKLGDHQDLIHTVNSIYQHPLMAEKYGLLYHFTLSVADSSAYLKTTNPIKMILEIPQTDGPLPNNIVFTKTDKDCAKDDHDPLGKTILLDALMLTTVAKGKKIYHGLDEFGTIWFEKHQFSTTSRDSDLQREKQNAYTKTSRLNEGRFIDGQSIKSRVTEGIYLFQTAEVDFETPCKIGLLGQNVVTIINSSASTPKSVTTEMPARNIFSLCKRKAMYDMKGTGGKHDNDEEGWIHATVAMVGQGDVSFDPRTVFHWDGHNLAIPKSQTQAHFDQKISRNEVGRKGVMMGHYAHQEEESNRIIQNNGYKVSYRSLRQEDAQLVHKTFYHFIIRQVLSNGYTLPLGPDANECELTLVDLINDGTMSSRFFSMPRDFSLEEDVINTPRLVAKSKFEGRAPTNTESSTHIVYEKDTNRRLVFPPAIDLRFATFLGLFSDEVLARGATFAQYKARGMAMVERAKHNTDKDDPTDTTMKYLSDVRGRHLILSAADWITRNAMKKLRYVRANNFFSYNDLQDIFEPTVAGSINVQSGKDLSIVAKGNNLNFGLAEGMQLKFNLQLQETAESPLVASMRKYNRVKDHTATFNFTGLNVETSGRTNLLMSYPIQKPSKPVPTNILVERPAVSDAITYSFITLKLKSFNARITKSVRFLSEMTTISDDSTSTPDDMVFTEKKKVWVRDQANVNHRLLNEEYPATVFEKTISVIEDDVFKNSFGFRIKFSTETISALSKDDVFLRFNIGDNFEVTMKYNENRTASLIIDDFSITLKIDEEMTVLFEYKMTNESAKKLAYFVSINKAYINDGHGPKAFALKLPYKDLYEKNLSLLPKVEEKLVDMVVDQGDIFQFVHEDSFFSYHRESSAGYVKKKFQVQAISRFQEFYPNAKAEDLYSDPSDVVTIDIENNAKPVPPTVKLTPLIYYANTDLIRRRTMQLMFEMDRPLQNGEKLAVVTREGDVVTAKTSAIGRDFTTKAPDFMSAARIFALSDFIGEDPNIPFVNKYLSGEILIPNSNLKVVPLDLYFENMKNKWIAVVALDQDKLRKLDNLDLEAYNPFLRLIFVRYNSISTEGNYISTPTQPQYINIVTERKLSIKDLDSRNTEIRILNGEQRKMNPAGPMTKFVVCLRERSNDGIEGKVIASNASDPRNRKSSADKVAKHYHIVEDVLNIEKQRNKLLCIYEFELFTNTGNLDSIDWMNFPGVRLVFLAEQS